MNNITRCKLRQTLPRDRNLASQKPNSAFVYYIAPKKTSLEGNKNVAFKKAENERASDIITYNPPYH